LVRQTLVIAVTTIVLCIARAALQLHSIKRRLRYTSVFPGVSVLSKPTPALSSRERIP
jgi:hypothetical protein